MKSSTPWATVNYSELLDAFDFVSAGAPFENSAYIDGNTGAIIWVSPMMDLEGNEVPDDLKTSDRYIAVPHKYDLDLGHLLALSFVDQELPDEYRTIADFFRKKGAYRRFKDWLDKCDLLEKWYRFEATVIEQTLRSWCKAKNIELIQ